MSCQQTGSYAASVDWNQSSVGWRIDHYLRCVQSWPCWWGTTHWSSHFRERARAQEFEPRHLF